MHEFEDGIDGADVSFSESNAVDATLTEVVRHAVMAAFQTTQHYKYNFYKYNIRTNCT